MRIISASIGPLAAASATAIAASQSGTGGEPLTLTSSPYVVAFPRRITVTSAADDSGITFRIVGTDWNGTPVTETLTGADTGAATSIYDYKTVVSITPSGNTAGAVTAGTSAVASTRPIFLDEYSFHSTAIQVNVSGTVNATVRQSLDDPNAVGYANVNWVNHPDSALVNLTSTVQGNYAYLPKVVQLLLNNGATGSDSVTIRVIQSASVPF